MAQLEPSKDALEELCTCSYLDYSNPPPSSNKNTKSSIQSGNKYALMDSYRCMGYVHFKILAVAALYGSHHCKTFEIQN